MKCGIKSVAEECSAMAGGQLDSRADSVVGMLYFVPFVREQKRRVAEIGHKIKTDLG